MCVQYSNKSCPDCQYAEDHSHLKKNSKVTENKIIQNIQRVLLSPLFPRLAAAAVVIWNDPGTRACFSNQPEAVKQLSLEYVPMMTRAVSRW